jgi:beta-galactosidase
VAAEVQDGIVAVDGVPCVLASADYPYYRDDPAVWADRLRSLRDELHIGVVSAYIPWRHHQPYPDRAPDFTGRLDASRDLVAFLGHCHRLGLGVILKPGPFIHAEVNYGGLPDWVRPGPDNGIEPVLDARGEPALWSGSRLTAPGIAEDWALPAPLDRRFRALTEQWLRTVGVEALRSYQEPHGPVRLVQIANEGLYTNGAQPLWAFDYSDSALAFFRARLRARYGSIAKYNRMNATGYLDWSQVEPPREWNATATVEGQQIYFDWGEFHADYLAEVYRLWRLALGADVPVVVNLNPPAGEEHAMDAWLARVRPELWPAIHYGFTNWMGVVSADPDAYTRYVVAAKRTRGPNLEENWGFSELYDRAYADPATSFHQTLLAMAAGATGFNVYTGVSTKGWGPELDVLHPAPYPDSAPVDATGQAGPKAPVVRLLADFFTAYGAEFLECAPAVNEAFGIYPPYAAVAAWVPGGREPDAPVCGRPLRAFHEQMRAAGKDYHLVNLETATTAQFGRYRAVTFHSGQSLPRRVQRALAGYVRGGGQLHLFGLPPYLDENLEPCTILADALLDGTDPVRPEPVGPGVAVLDGRADGYLRIHPDRPVSYLVVLVDSDNGGTPVRLHVDDGRDRYEVTVSAADGGAAVLRLLAGRLDACLVKGHNGFLDSAVPPSCAVGTEVVRADGPADLGRIDGVLRVLHLDEIDLTTQALA